MVRFELTTYGLRNRCSATELHRPAPAGVAIDAASVYRMAQGAVNWVGPRLPLSFRWRLRRCHVNSGRWDSTY